MTTNRKNGAKTAPRAPGGRFGKGNAGRPKGSRHKATLAAEQLFHGEAKKLARKAVDLALAGDTTALRLCLERLMPPRKDRFVTFDLPQVKSAADHPAALAAVMDGVARGDLTPGEAQAFAAVLEQHRKAIESAELAARIAALEARLPS